MISWFKYPFVRLLIPLMLGILSDFFIYNSPASKNVVAFLLIILGILLLLLLISSYIIKGYRNRWLFALSVNCFFFLLGVSLVEIQEYKIGNNSLSSLKKLPDYYVARLFESPTVKENSVKVILEIIDAENLDGVSYNIHPKILSYLEKDDNSLSLQYGDCILFNTNPEEVEKPPNPEQFDYKGYLYKKGVTHQVYLKSDAWLSLNDNRSNPVYSFSYWIRDFLLTTMQRLGIHGEEYAVAAAILLGYDDSLPYDLRQKYVATGAMHILCVSGLHVGVIFMVFSYMLVFLDERKCYQRYLKHILLLLFIWFYALLAGLAPSILRATIMLSFVIVGNIINKKGVLLNSLAASAFILLCINPFTLFDIGFQLSYVAVIGIVVLQKPILNMFYSKYKIVNKIWEVTSVTIAAQITTTPFTIFYFHQFPTYFWLSNLFMTPVSSIVIIGGMIMLLIFFIPYLNILIAYLVSKMIYVMNFGVYKIESLPYSIIKGLHVDELQFVILLVILLFVLLFAELKKKVFIFPMLGLISLFLIINVNNLMKKNVQKEMVIYSINNMTALDFISGTEHLLLTDSTFINDESAFSYNIENFLVKKGLYGREKVRLLDDDFDENFVKKRKSVVTFGEKLLGLSDGSLFSKDRLDYRIHLDYLLVYGRKRQSLPQLLNVYDFDYLVIDGSVPYYFLSDIKREADSLGIKYHSIRENGAFVVR